MVAVLRIKKQLHRHALECVPQRCSSNIVLTGRLTLPAILNQSWRFAWEAHAPWHQKFRRRAGCDLGHAQGITPLLAALTASSPGVSVVNIDNGFGAGMLAARILKTAAKLRAQAMSAAAATAAVS